MVDLKADFQYYLENKSKILESYYGKFIVIKNKEIIGSYDSHLLAIQETSKNHEVGTFIVQFVSKADNEEVSFHSRMEIKNSQK